jgi:acetyl-CoA carboxylase biotin carboxyl carrier protein
MGLTVDDVRALLAAFEASPWQEMAVTSGSDRMEVSRRPAAPTPAAAAPAEGVVDRVFPGLPSQAAPVPRPVTSPSVGVFRRAPSPTAAPLVEVGAPVGPDDLVAVLEVGAAVRPVPAGVAGTVSAVLVDDGAMVEYGDPLVLVSP